MCGINGIFAYRGAVEPIDRGELLRTRDHMAARGPDGKGEWISKDERVGFGHRRLSIIDLSDAGAQPMVNADSTLVVTFNGEIYNYHELRQELEAKGYRFTSNSDTEVLLHLYADKGSESVNALRGMFAFAIWDLRLGRLFLARDPLGIKPLYFANDGATFRFASQVKALLAGGGISRDPDPAGQVGFLLWGHMPEPHTAYLAVRSLPAGCMLVVDQGGVGNVVRYHSVAQVYCSAEAEPRVAAPLGDFLEQTRGALSDAVSHHLISDVPVGAFLSAGIDSGALVGLMRDVSRSEIKTVTIAFEEFRGTTEDEGPLAAEVARTYQAEHHVRVVTRQEFLAELPKILAGMDQPSIDGVNSWFVSKAAQELGLKVAISGLGGDELFGGYPSFSDIPRWVNRFGRSAHIPMLGRTVRQVLDLSGLARRFSSPKAAGLLELAGTFEGAFLLRRGLYMPWELTRLLDADTVREGLAALKPLERVTGAITPCPTAAFAKVATLETSLYMRNQLLRDTDWASMAHGLEVRVPLVDSVLLSRIVALGPTPAGTAPKAGLALAPRTALPEKVVSRAKTGFGVPTGAWIGAGKAVARSVGGGSARTSKGMDSRAWSQRVLAEALA